MYYSGATLHRSMVTISVVVASARAGDTTEAIELLALRKAGREAGLSYVECTRRRAFRQTSTSCPPRSTAAVPDPPVSALGRSRGRTPPWCAAHASRCSARVPRRTPSAGPSRSLRSLRAELPPPNGEGSPRSDLRHPGPLRLLGRQSPILARNLYVSQLLKQQGRIHVYTR
jgi:hypothetical protein